MQIQRYGHRGALSYCSPCRGPDFLSLKSQAFCIYFSFYKIILFHHQTYVSILLLYLLLYTRKDVAPFFFISPSKNPLQTVLLASSFCLQMLQWAVLSVDFYGYISSSFKPQGINLEYICNRCRCRSLYITSWITPRGVKQEDIQNAGLVQPHGQYRPSWLRDSHQTDRCITHRPTLNVKFQLLL